VLARWQSTIVDLQGNVLPAAQITVRREAVGSPLAVLYQDRDGTIPLGNPFPADSEGFAAFFTAGGPLRIDVAAGAFARTLRYVPLGLMQERDALSAAALAENALVAGDSDGGRVKTYTGAETVGDLNDIDQTSIYPADDPTANRPTASSYLVLTMRRAAGFLTQLAHGRDNAQLYARQAASSVWGAWRRLLTDADLASVADVRAATAASATDAQIITAPLIEAASAQVALIDAATVALDWDAFITGTLTIAGNRTLGNPSNAQPGTFRTLEVKSDGSGRSLAFDSNYRGLTTAITGINTGLGTRALITLYREATGATHIVVAGVVRY
jgi:hypothetical protein